MPASKVQRLDTSSLFMKHNHETSLSHILPHETHWSHISRGFAVLLHVRNALPHGFSAESHRRSAPFTGLARHHLYRTGGFQREIEQGDDLRRSRTMGPWGCGRTGLLSWHGITMIRPLYWDLPSGKQT
jgi:hypothetical protein